ncbi:unnamed protein product, partial [Symbiodinium necroappetens]
DDFDEAVRNSAGRSLGSSVEVGQPEVPSSYALYPRLSMDTKTGVSSQFWCPLIQSVPAHRRAAPPRMHFLTDPAEPEGAPAGQGHEDLVTVLEDRARARHMRSGSLMSQFMRSFAQNMKYAVLQDSKGDMPEEERQRQMRAIEAAKAQQEQQGGSGWSASPREPTHDLALLQHRPRRQPAALQASWQRFISCLYEFQHLRLQFGLSVILRWLFGDMWRAGQFCLAGERSQCDRAAGSVELLADSM